jgi:mannan endo-1,4-beta-mannosidase
MKLWRKTFLVLLLTSCTLFSLSYSSGEVRRPVTPKASAEVKALLKLLYDISGQYTLTGQHNYPNVRDRNSQFARRYIGKTPAIFSTDWGFAKDGDTDSYLARPDIVEEVKRQHQRGSLITICWHAVPPTANEPITFRPPSDNISSDSLVSVQGQLLDQQFQDVLTPGTKLYTQWCAQVDTIAVYLKQLRDAHVPILWRPYHEMNGSWFWWGGRHGKYGTAALYRQLFDRLVNRHKLNNLIWMWSVDRPVKSEMRFDDFFPGKNYVDVLTLDVYGSDFQKSYYDSLVVLSQGKPIALAEVGNPPALEVLEAQPKWTFYVTWAGMVRNTLKRQYAELMSTQRVLNLEDSLYWKSLTSYRTVCGLPPLPKKEELPIATTDFSGEWVLNEEHTVIENMGMSNLPFKLKITQNDSILTVQKIYIIEYANDRITTDSIKLDGTENRSEMWNLPMVIKTKWSARNDTLNIESKISFNRGGQTTDMTMQELWSLQDQGNTLSIKQFSNSFWGPRKTSMMYDKK